jgi:hypothetical protein
MTEKNSPDSQPAPNEPPARLVGYANPLGLSPSFVIPVFEWDGVHVLQIAGEDEKIEGFAVFRVNSLGPITELQKKVSVQRGDTALHGFIFGDKSVDIMPKEELTKRLIREKKRLSRDHFLYIDILKYLGEYEEIESELIKIEKIFRQNPAISKDLVELERKCLAEKKTSEDTDEPILKFADQDGFLNFWHLGTEIQHLIARYGRAYIRLKLLRSHSGRSPKVRKMLNGLGLCSKKINSESPLIPVDRYTWITIKAVSDMSMISEVKTFGKQEVSIKAVNSVSIRKRYYKKDLKKVVKGSHAKDYICIIRRK